MPPVPISSRIRYLPLRTNFLYRPCFICLAWNRVSTPDLTNAWAACSTVAPGCDAVNAWHASFRRASSTTPLFLTRSMKPGTEVGGGIETRDGIQGLMRTYLLIE